MSTVFLFDVFHFVVRNVFLMVATYQLVKTFVISVPGNVFEIAAILRKFIFEGCHLECFCDACNSHEMSLLWLLYTGNVYVMAIIVFLGKLCVMFTILRESVMMIAMQICFG